MKVVIIGAGEQGYVLTWNLARHPAVDEIVIGDWDLERAEEVKAAWGAGKTTAVHVDARDVERVASLAQGADLLLNAVIPEWDDPLMKAALKAKTHYLDMATRVEGGTIDDGYLLQIALDDDFKAIGRTALIHTGMTPGVTNTLAAIGYEEMERCEAVRIKAGGFFKSEVPVQVWSQETYYIDSQTPTLYFDKGEFLRAAPFAGWEYVDFPAPVGRLAAVLHEHEECSTLPRFLPKLGEKGLQHLDFKLAGGEEGMKKAKILVESGIASPIPRKIRGQDVRPIDVLVSVLPPSAPKEEIARLAAEGRIVDEGAYIIDLYAREGEPPTETFYVFPPNIQRVTEMIPGANRISYGTSTPAAIYAGYLLDGTITQTGVVPPEALAREVRLRYVEDLKRAGLRIARRSMRWL
jgi:saccharopine dehydrogenase-like NADP-dependent oxidoreductase